MLQEDWLADLNPDSLVVVKGAYATPELAKAQPGDRWGRLLALLRSKYVPRAVVVA